MIVATAHPAIEKFLGVFGPIEPKLVKLKIIGFDTEDDSKGTPISFAFHDGQNSFYTTDADEAIDYIYNAHETSVFVAHNLEYDVGNLFKHCDFKYIEEMIYASKLLRVTLFGTKNFMLNSASFFQGSLKSLGKLVGLPKLDGNPLDPAYNIRDAHIPQLFMSSIQDRLHADGVNLGLSIGQMAMSIFRRNFVRSKQVTFNPPVAVEEAYYGGRVEVFYKGVVKGPLYVADINSSYPDVMRNNPYPDTARMEPSTIATHRFGIGKFTVHIPSSIFVPPLAYRSEAGRLFFPTGDVTGWWTYAEVRKAVDMGARILSEEEGFGTNFESNPYREFVDHFWEQRQVVKAQLEKDPHNPKANFESLFLKLAMNNLYGKAAQHRPSTTMTRVRLSASKLRRLKGASECKIGPFYGYTVPREKAPKTANYLWGVYVTAYARLSLLEKMLAVHASGCTLVYCDTDSIMFTGAQGAKTLPIGPALGQLGVETYDLGVFRQAKGYLLCNKSPDARFHISKGRLFRGATCIGEGLPRKLLPGGLPPTFDGYYIEKVACKGVPTQHALPFIREGMAVAHKPMRLKEAVIRTYAKANKDKGEDFFKDIGVNVWKDVTKTMRGIYIKRKGNIGVTYPVDVSEIPELEEKAFGEPTRMGELDKFRIKNLTKKNDDVFRKVRIPKGWHKKTGFAGAAAFYESQRLHFLTVEELGEIGTGDKWFSGVCESAKDGKHGKYYLLRLQQFLGERVKRKNFLAALPASILQEIPEEKILGKHLEIILDAPYIKDSEAEMSLRIHDGKP